MKKLINIVTGLAVCGALMAGGIVTNTNQSASWVRMPAQDASTSISAVYFNPAGLMKLENGLHFSISNQTIFQDKRVENFYTGPGGNFGLNDPLYEGKVKAPVFPSVYGVYKLDKLAFSFGFNPIGGGGGATFDKGLPSFEMTPSDLVPALASKGVSEYRLNAFFEGTSVFFGFQGGVSYKINEMLSVFGGLRLVTAKNTYKGHLKDIELYGFGGSAAWTRADVIMAGIASSATTAAVGTTALVTGGAGGLTLAQARAMSIITVADSAAIAGGLAAFGSPVNVKISRADTVFKNAAAEYTATSSLLHDQAADVAQTGMGFTPIIGANLSFGEMLNIGIKYEFATKIELKNKTKKDFTVGFAGTTPVTMFPDGETLRNDMPAMLSVGARLKPIEKLSINAGTHIYFDKNVDYGKKLNSEYVTNDKVIDKNYYEIAAGVEYGVTEKIIVSAGYLMARTGVSEDYQNDLSYSLSSNTFGGGFAYNVKENIQVNLGVGYTTYEDGEKTVQHFFKPLNTNIPARETYYKDNLFIGVGVDLSF